MLLLDKLLGTALDDMAAVLEAGVSVIKGVFLRCLKEFEDEPSGIKGAQRALLKEAAFERNIEARAWLLDILALVFFCFIC